MKRTLIFLAMSALMLGWSCSRIEENAYPENPSSGTIMTITATVGEHFTGAPSDTKTALQPADESNKRAIWWTPGDALNVFYGSMGGSRFETNITEAQEIAPFYGMLGAVTGASDVGVSAQTFWGVYPYDEDNSCDGTGVTLTIPGEQPGIPGGFADKLNPTVANSPGLGLSFYNVGSWFIFTVTQEGISSLTVRGNNNEDIAGKVRVSMDSNGKPVSEIKEGVKSITIKPEGGGSFEVGEEYRIVLVPQTLSGGITITMRKGVQTATTQITSSLNFKRSSYLRKKNADLGVTWEEPYVEMADGFKWAIMNVGAEAPEEYGDYYAWGETSTKSSYTESNYHYIQPFYEVATNKWGEKWRTPTAAEWDALFNTSNYTWTWTTKNGIKGYEVTSKVPGYSGNSIFIPAAGYKVRTNTYGSGVYGQYWSSTLDATDSRMAKQTYFGENFGYVTVTSERYFGLSVRLIYDPSIVPPVSPDIPVTGVSFDMENYVVVNKGTYALPVKIAPANATIQDLTWMSSDPSVAIVSPTGVVTGKSVGTTTITVRTVDVGYRAACTVTVIPNASYVDMGDGTKWATMNVGADSPEESGDFFAWGETETKETYDWTTYLYGTSLSDITKYTTADGKTILEADDDAATVNMGSSWRMATDDEWTWLREHCTWTWCAMNGVKGCLVTSNVTGNASIFLPAAGYRTGKSIAGAGTYGLYWTSYHYGSSDGSSWDVDITSSGPSRKNRTRQLGSSVRAVYEPHQFINGHEYVELGDGLKWAVMNIGASVPEEYGDYFAWGETATKSYYDWSTYSDNPSGDGETFTKYAMDKKTQLDLEDDAARVNWGGTWRMPTNAELNALKNTNKFKCEWDDVRKGIKITSKISGYEGNSIFLPAAGKKNMSGGATFVGEFGFYWVSDLNSNSSANAVAFGVNGWGALKYDYRRLGESVRAVSD